MLQESLISLLPMQFGAFGSACGSHIYYSLRRYRHLITVPIMRSFSNVKGQFVGQDVETAQSLLKAARAVCFDVDSTVIMEEGIDVLAEHKGAGDAVAALTAKAMGGTVLFQDALKDRLDIIKPSKQDIDDCMLQHPLRFTPGYKNDTHLVTHPFYLVLVHFMAILRNYRHPRAYFYITHARCLCLSRFWWV